MSFIQEQILKTIVFEINEVVKKSKKNQASKKNSSLKDFISENFCKNKDKKPNLSECEGYILNFPTPNSAPYQEVCNCVRFEQILLKQNAFHLLAEKLEPIWPLKKGMVGSKLIAWQNCSSTLEINQKVIAFMIKCLSSLFYLEKNSTIIKYPFAFLFENSFATLLFWSDVRKYYMKNIEQVYHENKKKQFDFFHNVLPKNKLIVLSLEDTFFRLRSGSNMELHAFEQFINDLILANNALVVFSKQHLISIKKSDFYNISNYSITFKKSLDENKISLQEAMEPSFNIAKDERFIEANKIGAFDRLIELLTLGQNKLDNIERIFSEWKTKSEN
ncbi:hypothetical protein QEJ31_09195 [Pigmentibacter sp. JX0631]|uniref:hypothetical protein n=1 Tax=Pigmentibacter sp. JX0631 TaxID=2976982 RepID=UPI002468FE4E|nr:hypothetical protein [Pigmentibacter sp. JX0631]WGL58704.1 hypothetical protein QEJ31_09195 [Pigmentibacter sp. JX0631]